MTRKKRRRKLKTSCQRGHLLKKSNLNQLALERGRRECDSCYQARIYVKENPDTNLTIQAAADHFYEQVKNGPNVTVDVRTGTPIERPLFDDGLIKKEPEKELNPSAVEAVPAPQPDDEVSEAMRKLDLLRAVEGLISQEEIQLRTKALLDEVMGGSSGETRDENQAADPEPRIEDAEEETEPNQEDHPTIFAQDFLTEKAKGTSVLDSRVSRFGTICRQSYLSFYGKLPEKRPLRIDSGIIVNAYCYREKERHILDDAWMKFLSENRAVYSLYARGVIKGPGPMITTMPE